MEKAPQFTSSRDGGLTSVTERGLLIGLPERRGGDNMETANSAPSPVRLGRTSAGALQSKGSNKLLKNISTDLKDILMNPNRAAKKSFDRFGPLLNVRLCLQHPSLGVAHCVAGAPSGMLRR